MDQKLPVTPPDDASREHAAQPPAAAALPYAEFVTMMALLMALNAMAIDIILPSLQQMGESLHVADENARQLPLTAYVIVFGLSQLIYGPLADRFGRRPILLFGLVLYSLSCLGATLAPSFGMLLAMRGLQGLGAGATRVVILAVVRDTFGGRRMASVMSLVMMVFMAVPVFAPTLGQGIAFFAGWRGIFAFVVLVSVGVMAWCWLRLPETLREADRRPLRPRRVMGAFRIVITNRVSAAYGLGTAVMFGCLFGFLNSSQQIYQEVYGVGWAFPLYFSSSAVFMAIVSFTNARIVERIGMRRISHSAMIGFTLATGLLLVISLADGGHVPFWIFYALITLSLCQFGLIGMNFNALAMEPLGHVAGTASAVLGSLQTFLGGLIGAGIGYLYNGTVMPISLGLFVLGTLNVAVIVTADGRRLLGRSA